MNRIEMLRSIQQKHTNKSPKTASIATNENAPSERPETSTGLSVKSGITQTGITEQHTEKRPALREMLDNLMPSSDQILESLKPILNSNEQRKGKKMDIGSAITKDEKLKVNLPEETKGADLPAPPSVSFATMRTEIWENLMQMKRKQIDPKIAREFSKGCNTILRTISLELKAGQMFGGNDDSTNQH